MAEGEVADELVDPRGRHARLDDVGELVEAFGQRAGLAPGLAHLPGLAKEVSEASI
jgi:hypothetical protein